MASTTWDVFRDVAVAERQSDSVSFGMGAGDTLPVGLYSGYLYRSYLRFDYSFAGMTSITNATLHLRTSTQVKVAFGSDPDIIVQRITSPANFDEGTATTLSTTNATEWSNQPTRTSANEATEDVSTSENAWANISVTAMLQDALAAGSFAGFGIRASNEGSSTDVTEFWAREGSGSAAYITVEYTTNVAPSAPTISTPTAGQVVPTTNPTYTVTHNDSDGDALVDYDFEIATNATFTTLVLFDSNVITGISGNTITATHTALGGSALTRGTTYYARFRTRSLTGVLTVSPWSTTRTFSINQLPTVTFVTPNAVDANVEMTFVAGSGVNPRMTVRWNFVDPEGLAQKKYQVIVLTDASGAFYDSGEVTSTAGSLLVPVDPTRGNFYRVEVKVWDQLDEMATTGSRRCEVQWAIAEYRIDTGATVTAWSASVNSTGGTNKAIVFEYASSASGGAITTWFSTLGGAVLARWFHFRVFLTAWNGATTPSVEKLTLTYTNSAAVPPDGWTASAQHALDTDTRVFGTQSLKVTCDGTSLNAYQSIPVEPNTDYILSGRIKSSGNSGAKLIISSAATSGDLAATTAIVATQEWGRVNTGVWNSGANSSVFVRCFANGAGGTFAWFDALKMEASTVVTPWTPGFVGTGVTVDAGGLMVDAQAGATFRLQGSTGGSRDRIQLGEKGLRFGDSVGPHIFSGAAGILTLDFADENADGVLRINADTGNTGKIEWGDEGTYDTNLYRGAANILKTDDNLEALSLAIGTNKVTRTVFITPSTVVNTNRSSDLASTSIEVTAVPSTGVVAVFGYIRTRVSDTSGGEYYAQNYGTSDAGGNATCTGVANRYGNSNFICKVGGTNNRQINHEVAWISGTQDYILVVTGYITTE